MSMTGNKHASHLESLRRRIEWALSRAMPRATVLPHIVHEAMRYCVFSNGKRFRPLLVLSSCESVGAPVRQAIPAALAVELIHTYSLVHDDLPAMDNTSQRRGQPSCHRRYGEANAILAGDALLTLAFEILSRNGEPNALAIIRTIGQAGGTRGLIGGQVMDLQVAASCVASREQTLLDVAKRKTSALIEASVMTGALAGGADSEELMRLRRYAKGIGLAFQIIDDVHDMEGLYKIMGAERARCRAGRLIRQAVNVLEPFGKRADGLRELANWLLASSQQRSRKNGDGSIF